MKTLSYQLARVGNISITLYDSSHSLYDLLNKAGHIQRLKQNFQFGAINSVFEGAHHTRWEYVIVQLYILDVYEEHYNQVSGLSSKIKINNAFISGSEIVQSWILLLNIGHLIGTFANERAMLNIAKENNKIYNILKMDYQKIKKYAISFSM